MNKNIRLICKFITNTRETANRNIEQLTKYLMLTSWMWSLFYTTLVIFATRQVIVLK